MSLRNLLERVEACYKKEETMVCNKVWRENGRAFKLERRANEVGRLILCSVCDGKAKRFNLFFPKSPKGWSTLANKLQSLGVRLLPYSEGQSFPTMRRTLVLGNEVDCLGKGSSVDVVSKSGCRGLSVDSVNQGEGEGNGNCFEVLLGGEVWGRLQFSPLVT